MLCRFVSGCNKIWVLIRWTATCRLLFLSFDAFSSTFSWQLQLSAVALVIRGVQCKRLLPLPLPLYSIKISKSFNDRKSYAWWVLCVGTYRWYVTPIIPGHYTWVSNNCMFWAKRFEIGYILQARWKFVFEIKSWHSTAVTDKDTMNNLVFFCYCVSRLNWALFIYIVRRSTAVHTRIFVE